MAALFVPDTSVLIDGRISELILDGRQGSRVLVPMAALAELEAQANRGLETGVAGLDELSRLQRMAAEGDCEVEYVGERPTSDEIERASTGAIDARIRDAATAAGAVFVTSDRIQAHAADAQGIDHIYMRPVLDDDPDLRQSALWSYFRDDTMSVHLKADHVPMAKTGTPAGVTYAPIGAKATSHQELRGLIKECIEFAKRDYHSFVELERHGCTVLQMGPVRVTIAQRPFSDALEVTAVRPVFKATLDDYDLPADILQRIEGHSRGVFIAGPPGSGKSTFAAAVATHLHGLDRVVKTMEQPRDLQVPGEITQYGALDKDMAWTGEVMLLVRPDNVVYDEVRTSKDFAVFADMRMAGIGLVGVTHASRPIDAVQRLIGRVELGMIPQVVDTIVFIDKGAIGGLLELRFTVKVPAGMTDSDLARPVVMVRDIMAQQDVFELYTYGEQIVVMPIDEAEAGGVSSPTAGLAEQELQRRLRRFVRGPFEVQVRGDKATLLVDEAEVPALIGKGGKTVQLLERKLGISLDVRARQETPARARRARSAQGAQLRRTGNNVFLMVGPSLAGQQVVVDIEGAPVAEGKASNDGRLRFKATTAEAKAIVQADRSGLEIQARRA